MLNNDFIKPGIASIALAILFPLYWITVFGFASEGFESAYRADLTSLTWSDFLMVIIGFLEVYIYLHLRRALNSFLNSNGISVTLMVMAILVGLFHLSVLIDVLLTFSGSDMQTSTVNTIIDFITMTSITVLVLYSITALVFCLIILFTSSEKPVVLKIFATLLLLCAIFQLTFILAPISLLLFPVALITLAIYFLKEPDTVELI